MDQPVIKYRPFKSVDEMDMYLCNTVIFEGYEYIITDIFNDNGKVMCTLSNDENHEVCMSAEEALESCTFRKHAFGMPV